jgi:hypothetical protein
MTNGALCLKNGSGITLRMGWRGYEKQNSNQEQKNPTAPNRLKSHVIPP